MVLTRPTYRRYLALVVILGVGVLGVWGKIALFADGSHFLVNLLTSGELYLGNPERPFSTFVNEAPILLAMKLGVTGMTPLTLVFSLGVVLVPAIVWAAAAALHMRTRLFWPFVLMWAAIYLNTGLFAVGEYNITYAVIGLVVSILLLPRRIPIWLLIVLIAASVLLCRAYESVAIIGPLLALLALVRFIRGRREDAEGETAGRVEQVGLLVSALLLVIATLISVRAIFSSQNPGEVYLNNQLELLRDRSLLFTTLACLALLIAAFLPGMARRVVLWVAFIIGALTIVPLIEALTSGTGPNPWGYYNARTAATGLAVVLIVWCWRLATAPEEESGGESVPFFSSERLLSLACTFTAGFLACTFAVSIVHFHSWVNRVGVVVESQKGLVPFEKSGLSTDYVWDWALPSLSLVLQTQRDQGIVLGRPEMIGWQPFDPMTSVPVLPQVPQ